MHCMGGALHSHRTVIKSVEGWWREDGFLGFACDNDWIKGCFNGVFEDMLLTASLHHWNLTSAKGGWLTWSGMRAVSTLKA